jgi:hypothetical protein
MERCGTMAGMGVKVDPGSYAWLRDSHLEVAGCVTVVAAADEEGVKTAFGCGEEVWATRNGGTAFLDTEAAHLVVVDGALVVSENNGFQGSRGEVLRPASQASETGKAASIFWNVNDAIYFACARRGKTLCTLGRRCRVGPGGGRHHPGRSASQSPAATEVVCR